MHRALEIEEILFNIFVHFDCSTDHCDHDAADLASLARTCRTFQEPALDVLWQELQDLSPLARCLPEACHQQLSNWDPYSIRRPLTQTEWDVLQSYTRRIRSISIKDICGVSKKTIIRLSTAPEPLFPNLHSLYFDYYTERVHILLLPLPSLVSLHLMLYDAHLFHRTLKSVAKTSPNLQELHIEVYHCSSIDENRIYPSLIQQWRNLKVIDSGITFDVNTLLHASRMSALTELAFTLNAALPGQICPSDLPLIFSNLCEFYLHSGSLHPISTLLSQARLPALTSFCATIKTCPTRSDFTSFLTSIRTSCAIYTVQELHIYQSYTLSRKCVPWDSRTVFGWKDLQPCMGFSNIRRMTICIEWKVDLTDSQLLTLVSAWPRLEQLSINREWGWAMLGGITPNGLLQLLQMCPLLHKIILAIDTRGYTEFSPSLGFLELTLPPKLYISAVDSFIEEQSVPAITSFFIGVASHSNLVLTGCRSQASWAMDISMYKECQSRWHSIHEQVKEAVARRLS